MSRKLKNKVNRNVHLIAYNNPQSPITEQYRLIRNNLNFSSVDKEIKSIVVTSPEPSDGKSTTAANLAIVLAQQGNKVLLVDADLRKPSVHYSFNIGNIEGLTSILTKKMNVERAVIKTNITNLEVLTSGPIPPNPSELLSSSSLDFVLKELREMYEYIVLDTPPLLAVTDAQNLANKCDGVVLVVSSKKTKRDRALKAKDLLEKANSFLLGVVLNGVAARKTNYYGHYN
ncbi:CpsD/CapB family tyrosine-protein kinase [Neobacillus mesonae]|uniref:non-specific protein-tyrosine kinase n=1 Tax=Neobacillus mesonae TaxID=1193713 RepID=A0A3Q9R182_9BACI|nr:CpsD/CapB family tyrosine-protein kinase [Neobacillus mesonae]AZU63764.1 capsular biosynthesis protein [Neobacillus mesonae]MED4204729.1 CpsD/CapB family tyrosine-protein kinase [Neobacillus mesonae]